jgi:hypothetical protein
MFIALQINEVPNITCLNTSQNICKMMELAPHCSSISSPLGLQFASTNSPLKHPHAAKV